MREAFADERLGFLEVDFQEAKQRSDIPKWNRAPENALVKSAASEPRHRPPSFRLPPFFAVAGEDVGRV
jgi:hypothetical protein